MTLSTLIPRIEQAGPDEQRELLEAVWAIVKPQPFPMRVPRQPDGSWWPGDGLGPYTDEWKDWHAGREDFRRKLDAEAYLDAAMMLKPEGWGLDLKLPSANKCVEAITGKLPVGAILHHMTFPSAVGVANTPAMALLAAICRATVEEGEDGTT